VHDRDFVIEGHPLLKGEVASLSGPSGCNASRGRGLSSLRCTGVWTQDWSEALLKLKRINRLARCAC
jgi:hypothetical protein